MTDKVTKDLAINVKLPKGRQPAKERSEDVMRRQKRFAIQLLLDEAYFKTIIKESNELGVYKGYFLRALVDDYYKNHERNKKRIQKLINSTDDFRKRKIVTK